MSSIRAQVTVGLVCLLLGVGLVMQFRSQRLAHQNVPASATDQAVYISQLSESNADLRRQVEELEGEITRYGQGGGGGSADVEALEENLRALRIANGDAPVSGPGVSVLVEGDANLVELQDLVNELRNASAEAVAVNGVRVVARSAIIGAENGRIAIDRQALSPPYTLEAIGDPDTLVGALERKGGLIALLEAGDDSLNIEVTRH
ncbi:MAG TPA: DUF881 domain-containing protein, partial [Chloroflexia bacterium]|nr:DUF881 domain-containing protein [Chloroflexia bacterium]